MKTLKKALAAIMLASMVIFTTGCLPDENAEGEVKVTTHTPKDITSTTAVCGCEAIVNEGFSVAEIGVCWGTSLNPTLDDSYLSTTDCSKPFVCTLTELEPETNYYVRGYALRNGECFYGYNKNFTTLEDENPGGGGGGLICK